MQQIKKSNGTVVALFAHPDDEAFGPGGTIFKLSKKYNVYLICATRGEAGEGNKKELGRIRSQELLNSAQILGVKKVFFLEYLDGNLSNSLYHQMSDQIKKILDKLKPEILMTQDINGVSGHIDHVAVSMVSSYLFRKLRFVKKIMYYCLDEKTSIRLGKDYFIYFPPGYKKSQIDEVIDVSDVWDIKVDAMMAHVSQIKDAKRILQRRKGLAKEEYFRILKK